MTRSLRARIGTELVAADSIQGSDGTDNSGAVSAAESAIRAAMAANDALGENRSAEVASQLSSALSSLSGVSNSEKIDNAGAVSTIKTAAQSILRIGRIASDEEEVGKLQRDDSPLAVVVFYAHAVSHAQRSDAGEDGRA